MLDATTKRKIDSARQILVGKVPDPKAQVEQITTALVYKFMDDMDKEAEELGGKAKFFTDDLKDFAWSKLLDTRYAGQKRMDLYVRAISAFSKAKQLPQLFRDIFKDAFLPYRDPETLSLFLKEIDNFTYDNSEDLGNAFEYLLSVLGSQGDAGQFRTPRHIIDFIVAVVDPKKNETVLDPACGTAGFLISAYKHIRKHNSSNFEPEKEKAEDKLPKGETIAETVLIEKSYRGDLLTPSERGKLMNNFVGYDISPDMVKLSLVNMYLHGFPNPKIYEYDTLSSEKHWGEQFDVIMANPPFMSPKGGIRPHKRFSVQASRSEVLFVDYILEHLALKGRAGIIVPEGIIFKSEKAYKQLRQMLVEDGLFAVVSLPPGVFNPYSGVKTSVLLFDNELAKKSGEILFLKIENDGFDLGAQRRKIEKNDLPTAINTIEAFQQYIKGKYRGGNLYVDFYVKDKKQKGGELYSAYYENTTFVNKKFIAKSGDYNLAGERYREPEIHKNQKWPLVELEEVCVIKRGSTITKKQAVEGDIPVIAGGQQPAYYHNEANRESPVITVSASGAYAGFVNFFDKPVYASDCSTIQPRNEREINLRFIYRLLKSRQREIYQLQQGGGQPHVYPKDLAKIKIPLPPSKVQKEIVEQIEVKQNAINHAKEIIKNLERERRYFGQELRTLEDVEWVELGKIGKISMCKRIFKDQTTAKGDVPFYKIGTFGQRPDAYISQEIYDEYTSKYPHPKKGDILISTSGTIGRTVVYDGKSAYFQDSNIVWIDNDEKMVTNEYLHHVFQSIRWTTTKGGTIERLYNKLIEKTKIPVPTLKVQKQLVAEAEKEEEIIIANRRVVEIMEQKISNVLNQI